MNGRPTVAALVEREADRRPARPAPTPMGRWPTTQGHRPGWTARRRWAAAVGLAVILALWRADAGPGSINDRGWPLVQEFAAAAVSPELSGEFLSIVLDSVAVTVAYAVAGTSLSVVIGLVGGVLTSETWWRRDPLHRRGPGVGPGWWLARAVVAVPRGIHEAIWALFLLQILGRDPMVAVLAIGVPFGAITAKVVAEFIDDAARAPYDALRAAGAGRLSAMTYALAPLVGSDVTSYAFYRLECSLRSAVVLGMIGAGGIGFQLSLSFQTLRYGEIWTLVFTLVLLSAVVDRWSATIRTGSNPRWRRWSIAATVVATAASAWRLELRPQTLLSERTRTLAADVAAATWPPRLPDGGWSTLSAATVDTLVISIIAIAVASVLAWPVSLLAARGPGDRPGRVVVGAIARLLLLVTRSVPPPVWALIVVFVVFPGPLAGGLALGAYTFGVLGRLDAEVIENADPAPARSLRVLGASRSAAFAYGTMPTVAPRVAALSLYRWEVAMRETVIVGLVGAGGLGRILSQQNAAFDRAGWSPLWPPWWPWPSPSTSSAPACGSTSAEGADRIDRSGDPGETATDEGPAGSSGIVGIAERDLVPEARVGCRVGEEPIVDRMQLDIGLHRCVGIERPTVDHAHPQVTVAIVDLDALGQPLVDPDVGSRVEVATGRLGERGHGDRGEGLQHGADDPAGQSRGVAPVGQQGDGDAIVGNDPQVAVVADRRPVVADHAPTVPVEQHPPEPPGVGNHARRHRDLGLLHGVDRCRAEHPGAIGGEAVGQVEPGQLHDVAGGPVGGGAGRPVRSGQEGDRRDPEPAIAVGNVANGGAVVGHLVGERLQRLGPDGRGQEPLERIVPGHAPEPLDDAPGHDEAGIAVGEPVAGAVELGQCPAGQHEALDAVVATAGVLEEVAVHAAGVGQELTDGDLGRGFGIAEGELGQVGANGLVEVDEPVVDELHDQAGRPDLRDRTDLEHRIRCRLDPGVETHHARGALERLLAGHNGQ